MQSGQKPAPSVTSSRKELVAIGDHTSNTEGILKLLAVND